MMKTTPADHVESLAEGRPEPQVHIKTIVIVAAIDLIYFAQVLNVVGSGVFAHDITQVVGGAALEVWLTSILTIMTTVLSPPISQAADYWGRKWFLVIATGCGGIGSIIVARANSIGMVIAGLGISGISFGVQPLLHAVVSEVLPRKHRPWAQASVTMAAAVGGVVGLLVGEALTRNQNAGGFRGYWYMTTGIYLLSTIACLVFYNPPPTELQRSLPQKEKLRRLDWIGYIILVGGLSLFCLGLSWSQNPYSWTNAHVLAPFILGAILVVVFILYETFLKQDGMAHRDLFDNRNFPIALICIFVEGLSFFAANNYFAFEVSVLYAPGNIQLGLQYSITFFSLLVGAAGAGAFCAKMKSVRWPLVFSFGCFVVFNSLMASVHTGTSQSLLWVYPVFLGVGLGVCLVSLLTIAQFSTPAHLIAITSGLVVAVRSLGATVGLAVFNAIFNHIFNTNLVPTITDAVLPLGLPATSLEPLIEALLAGNKTAIASVADVDQIIIEAAVGGLTKTYLQSFKYCWVAAACFSAVAVILSCLVFNPISDFNTHIDAPIEIIEVQREDTVLEVRN